MLVIRKIIRLSSECESTRGLVKCCILLFLEKEKIDEKTSGMWDFGQKGAGTRDQDPPSNLSTPFVCAWVTTLGEGLLLGILGGGVPPGSPNPDPISDQKNVI